MSRVLLAGESWVNTVTDYKGFDAFPHSRVLIGCERLLEVLRGAGHNVTHLLAHDVGLGFPETIDELAAYDVVILSDIGANSLLLHPAVFSEGRARPNRLKLLADWVRSGGGLMMAGGYMSFQGFQGKANFHATPVEAVLPVDILPYDDRVEAPEGATGHLADVAHPITDGLDHEWPLLLGYQRLVAKPESTVLAHIDEYPLLSVRQEGHGRTLAFASDVSPHWAPEEFMRWPGYGQLFDQAVRWLAGETNESA